jgi:hypothetical protein
VRTYIAQYNAELVKFDGAAFTSLAANTSPKCRYLAKGMKSERMWAAGFDAGASLAGFTTNIGPSTMAWSDPASPESWPIANYQNFGNDNLNPITAIAEFSGQIFVFKNNRFWVVYSITSSGGVTTLNYRPVSGAGCIQPGAYAVTEVGIFFLGADGLYLTDGSTPVKISGNINGLFTGNLPAWTTYNRLLPLPVKSVSKFAVSGDWIYMMGGNTSSGGLQSSCTLAYNYRTQAWSYFTQSVAALLPMPWTDISYPLVVGVKNTGTNYQLFNYHPFLKTDNAAFMTAEAHLNWFQMPTGRGYVAMDTAKVHRLDAWGLGHCQVGAAYDFNVAASGWVDLRFSELPTGDVWDSGSVWGDGSDLTDVWGGAISSATDLLRLTPPSHKFAFNPPGRGRYVSLAFRKMSDATFFYIERPRMTLVTRTAPPR